MLSRVVTGVFVLVMALLATWLVLFDSLGAYVCAALLASMTLALAAVRPDRRWLYGVLVMLGSAVSGLLIGASLQSLRRGRRGTSPAAELETATLG